MRLLLILNPNSGAVRKAGTLPDRLRAHLAMKEGLSGELILTERPGHAFELACEACKSGTYDAVVAVGGDGTVNEIGKALVNQPIALGILPLGSGNGLARELGLPLDTEKALAVLKRSRLRRIDVGLADGHPFFCASGTGFDAEVVHLFNQRKNRGFVGYLLTAAKLWRSYQARHYRVHSGSQLLWEGRSLLLAAANAAQFGNNARIAPQAKLDDGLLDLVSIPPAGFVHALPLVWRLFNGSLPRARGIQSSRSSSFIIEGPGPSRLHVDGEVFPCPARYEVRILPGALKVLV